MIGGRHRSFKPVIRLADRNRNLLSFRNLVEASVLSAIRRRYEVRLIAVRRAVRYLAREMGISHPLALHDFLTDGVDLFVEEYGLLVHVSGEGQIEMRDLIGAERTEADGDGQPTTGRRGGARRRSA